LIVDFKRNEKEHITMRLKLILAVVAVGATVLLGAKPAGAHHAFAATFDTSKPVTVKGTITKVELINPHSWFWMDVTDADGNTANWGFEGGSPNSLIRHGVTKNTVPVGTVLIVQGYLSKAFEHKGVGVNITFTDGRKFLLGGSAPGAEGNVAEPNKDEGAAPPSDKK
jgi:Family of unknown function (DUF6152)